MSVDLFHTDYSGWFPFVPSNPYAGTIYTGNSYLGIDGFSIPSWVEAFWRLKSFSYETDGDLTLTDSEIISGGPVNGRGESIVKISTITGLAGTFYIGTGTPASPILLQPGPFRAALDRLPVVAAPDGSGPPDCRGTVSGTTTSNYPDETTGTQSFGPLPIPGFNPGFACGPASLMGWKNPFVPGGTTNRLVQNASQFYSLYGLTIFNPSDPTHQGYTPSARVGSSNLILKCGTDIAILPLTLAINPILYVEVQAFIAVTNGSNIGTLATYVSGPGHFTSIAANAFILVGDTCTTGVIEGGGPPGTIPTGIGFAISSSGPFTPGAGVMAVTGAAPGATITFSKNFYGPNQTLNCTFFNPDPPPNLGGDSSSGVPASSSTGDIIVSLDTFW